MTSPLRHLVVLDLSQYLAGPFGTQILGDLGARIVKVEPPVGDLSRDVPPSFVGESSSYFLGVNRNKRSVVIDLKSPAGHALLLRLIPHVDVVVENFRPGVTDRLGIGYDVLRQHNRRLVMCSVTGFGQDGPDHARPAFDMVVQALSGVMSLTGHPGGPPARVGVPIGDLAAGMYAAIGVLAALPEVERTGVGRYIDVSMLDSQVSLLSYLASAYSVSGVVPGQQGRGHQSVPTYRAFTCGDGVDIVVTANTERMWERMCAALDVPELTGDPRFTSGAGRLEHRAELEPLLEVAFAALPSEVILRRFRNLVPSAPINTVDRALTDPQVRHRNMVLHLDNDRGERIDVVGNPVKFGGTSDPAGYPPRLGQHTRSELIDLLGLTHAEVDALALDGAVAEDGTAA